MPNFRCPEKCHLPKSLEAEGSKIHESITDAYPMGSGHRCVLKSPQGILMWRLRTCLRLARFDRKRGKNNLLYLKPRMNTGRFNVHVKWYGWTSTLLMSMGGFTWWGEKLLRVIGGDHCSSASAVSPPFSHWSPPGKSNSLITSLMTPGVQLFKVLK